MGVATRCGCKEVYRFPHTSYPYSSCICFLQQHCSFFLMFDSTFKSSVYILDVCNIKLLNPQYIY